MFFLLIHVSFKAEYSLKHVFICTDEQAIRLPGRLKLYLGERATIAAFIDPNVSTLCRVYWQKKNKDGVFHTIDITDWKYTGSTLTFPTPTLNVNFIRKEDEGIYRIVVDTFNSKKYNTVQIDVIKGGSLFIFCR